MKNYSKQTLPTIHQFHKLKETTNLIIIKSHIEEKLREMEDQLSQSQNVV